MSAVRAPTLANRRPHGARSTALERACGIRAQLMSDGGTVISLEVPDRAGKLGDVVLGLDDLAGYLGASGSLGR